MPTQERLAILYKVVVDAEATRVYEKLSRERLSLSSPGLSFAGRRKGAERGDDRQSAGMSGDSDAVDGPISRRPQLSDEAQGDPVNGTDLESYLREHPPDESMCLRCLRKVAQGISVEKRRDREVLDCGMPRGT